MGYLHTDDEEENINDTTSTIDEYSKKAWNFYENFEEEKALHYIDLALDLDRFNSNNWNIKAIILEAMRRYGESEECYNKSLNLSNRHLVRENKARMLKKWAGHLINISKKVPYGLPILNEALEKNRKAINSIPHNSKENQNDYILQKDSINYLINHEKEYLRNLETLKTYSKDELFTIAGREFYKNNIHLTPGMALKLVKEPYNKYDGDAIAVYVCDKKTGYVANNAYTYCKLTSPASELQDKFKNIAQGSYLLYLCRYADISFYIGRIIR